MRAGCVWNAGRPVEGIEAFGTLLGPEITGPCFPWSGALCAGRGGGVCCFWVSRACRHPVFPLVGVRVRV